MSDYCYHGTTDLIVPNGLERFVLQWGDLGGQWGVNRSVAQMHALLCLAGRPLHADDIVDKLGLARSNVSNSLKEMQTWRLIRRVQVAGDRRDHFKAETNLWEIAARSAKGRKAREIDPAIAALRACVLQAEGDPRVSATALSRLTAMLAFSMIERWYTQMLGVPRGLLAALTRMGAKITLVLSIGRKRKAEAP